VTRGIVGGTWGCALQTKGIIIEVGDFLEESKDLFSLQICLVNM
jgi:hypothetical protein